MVLDCVVVALMLLFCINVPLLIWCDIGNINPLEGIIMAICNYREDGMCTHPRNEGKAVPCNNPDSYETQASQLVDKYGLNGAVAQATWYMAGAVGQAKKEWQLVIGILMSAVEARDEYYNKDNM